MSEPVVASGATTKPGGMTGEQALENFHQASKLVTEGKIEEARKVPLLPSDRKAIERRIEKRQALSS